MSRELKNKPLVEAIVEIRWKLKGTPPGPQVDPHYKLLLGRLFDRLHQDYPEHEQLPTANIPDELVGHVIQHRFRSAANAWPLVQVGPGIYAINSTDDYKWHDFRTRVITSVEKLYDAHPKPHEFKITNLTMRYIDAIQFDYEHKNAFAFLKEHLKLNISLPDNLFQDTSVDNRPNSFTWQSSFSCQSPMGQMDIRFATGQKNNMPAIIWETVVESTGDDVPEMPKAFNDWLDAAHDITDDWFFKIIEGELERRFSSE